MKGAIRWSIAITGTLIAFGLTIWLSLLAGADEGWALGLGALAATLVLAALQTWATSPLRPVGSHIHPIPPPPVPPTESRSPRGEMLRTTAGELSYAGESVLPTIQTPSGHKVASMPGTAATGIGPGLLIRVGDVPQRPPVFQPRAKLYDRITGGGRVAVVQALTGMRGVGKTQLAAEFARQCIADGWPVVAWITAENAEQITAGLTELGDALGLRRPGDDSETLIRKVRRWLETVAPEHTLVIFDNAVDADMLAPSLPVASRAQIVITSNHHAFENLGVPIDIDVFSPAEALAFLREKTGLDDTTGARDLAEEVGHLPLALGQSAAVIKRAGLTYQTFLARLRRVAIEDYVERYKGDAYPHGAAETVLVALDTAERDNPLVRSLTDLLAVFSPVGVDRDLLYAAAEQGIVPGDARDVDRSLGALAEASLLAFGLDGRLVIMHRFTQRVARDHARKAGTLRGTVEAIVRLLGTLLVPQDEVWAKRSAVDHLVLQIVALWESTGADPRQDAVDGYPDLVSGLIYLRCRAVGYLAELADVKSAIRLGRELLADAERILGPDHPRTLSSRHNLAFAYARTGRVQEAITLHEQNLADRERLLGADHPDTLASRHNLAAVYRDAARLDEAITLHEQNLADRERLLGADHPDTLISRNSLAYCYQDAGRLDEAITLFRRGLAERERLLGADHPDTLTSRNDLATTYRQMGRLTEAATLYRRCIADRERVLGADHPDTLTSRYDLATTYRQMGRLDEAISLHEQTLRDYQQVLSPGHPWLGVVSRSLESVRRERDRRRRGRGGQR